MAKTVSSFWLSLTTVTPVIESWVCVPHLEIGWTLCPLWERGAGWRDTVWRLRFVGENASLLSMDAGPGHLATIWWGRPNCPSGGPQEEDWKSPAHNSGYCCICQPEPTYQPCQSGSMEVNTPAARWQSGQEQRWGILTKSCPKCRYMRKINDCCCFKPFGFLLCCAG